MVPTSQSEAQPPDDRDESVTGQHEAIEGCLSRIDTETEDQPSIVAHAQSHHRSRKEEYQTHLARPTRGSIHKSSTAKTAMSRQPTYMSRQQTGLSKQPSRQNEERGRQQQAPNAHEAEVDPEYYEQNPWYGQPRDQTIFGLNKPLPHKVRPGTRQRTESRLQQESTAQQEEDEIEAAQLKPDPYKEQDAERGEIHDGSHGLDDEERKNKHGQPEDKGKKGSRRSRGDDYFDQNPDRSRSTHEGDVPVLPPGQEDIEKDGLASPILQAGVHRFSREHQSQIVTRYSLDSRSRGREPRIVEEKEPSTGDEEAREASANTSSTHVGQSDGKDKAETPEDFRFSDNERDDFENPDELHIDHDQYRNAVGRYRAKLPRAWGEFWGTSIAVCFGLCVNLSIKVSASQPNQYGAYETQCWGWGLGFMTGIYITAGISGAHLNPVISIVFAFFRGFPFHECFYYIIAQISGGFFGGGVAYLIFQDALNAVDPSHSPDLTATAFYPGPQSAISIRTSTAFFSEFTATAFLILIILALGDDQNAPPGAGLAPVVIGLVIVALMMAFGYNTGPALSPARDLGPRVVALARGYQENPFANGFWWWGAWGATILGGICGAVIYDTFIFVGNESPINMTTKQLKDGTQRRWREVQSNTKQLTYEAGQCMYWLAYYLGLIWVAKKLGLSEKIQPFRRQFNRFISWAAEFFWKSEQAVEKETHKLAQEAKEVRARAQRTDDLRRQRASRTQGVLKVTGGRTAY